MEFIKKNFKYDEILLMYRCGSYAFKTNDEESDEDYIVVLKNFKGFTYLNNERKEYFILGINEWKDKMEFSDNYSEYYQIFNDEIMAYPNNVIYMDDSMKEMVKEYQDTFTSKIKIWLKKVYSYFIFYYKFGDLKKNMYHLIRISYIVNKYNLTGSFSLDLDEETNTLIRNYKRCKNREPYRSVILESLDYISKEINKDE